MQVLVISKIAKNFYNRPQKVRVGETDDVDTLYQLCAKTSGIPQEELIIKFNRDGYTLRIISGWSFEFYQIKENSVLYIETVIDQDEPIEPASPRLNNAEITRKLMELSKLKNQGLLEGNYEHGGYEMTASHTAAQKPGKQKEEQLKTFVTALRKGEAEFNQFIQENKLAKEMLDTCDGNGWYPVHYAINYSNKAGFSYILSNSDNLNQTTKEGITPLMLAVNKKSPETFKALIESKKLDINKITKKGSIIHFLCDLNDMQQYRQYIAGLLNTNINPYAIDHNKRVAADLLTDAELKLKLIRAYEKDQNYSHIRKKPDAIRGTVFKTGLFFRNLNTRYLELNTNERCLLRYENKAEYPHKPREIIPLRDIVSVKENNERMFLQHGFYYFEVTYDSRNIFATKSQALTTKWVQSINEAVDYALKYESTIKDMTMDEKAMEVLSQPATEVDLDTSPISSPNQEGMVSDQKRGQMMQPLVKANLDTFEVLKKLGRGSFGVVYKVKCKFNNKTYAMKALQKDKVLLNKQLKYAQAEANILRKNNNPFVLSLYFAFQTPTCLYMVMDCCSQQNLSLLILKQNNFTEAEARFYIAEIILGVEYLHMQGVLYRDLKPENVLVATDGHLMLCDFGLSKENVGRNELATSFVGSRLYLAPEMVKGQGFSPASDIFAIGLVLYEMIFGDVPYTATDEKTLYEQIRNMAVEMPEEISKDAEDLILKLLIKDPEKRLGAKSKEEIKRHPFFKDLDWEKLSNKEINPPLYEQEFDRTEGRAAVRIPDQDYDDHNKNFLRIAGWSFTKATEV